MTGWHRRIVVVVVVWLVVYGALAVTGFGIQMALLTVLIAVVAGVVYAVYDLGDIVRPAWWVVSYQGRRQFGGADRRAARLRRWLEVSTSGETTTPLVRDALRAVVADIVEHDHAIGLHDDPDAARRILGSELAAYLLDPDPGGRRLQPRDLADLVTRIEALSPDPPGHLTTGKA